MHWYETDEDDVTEIIARAVDVDGLFSDPVPVAREQVVLRGCPPEFADLTGDFQLEVAVSDETQWWNLTDLVVHGTVPNGAMVDVIASASVRLCADGYGPEPGPRHILFQENERVGDCLAADGFPRPSPGHEWPPMTLIGVEHPERIQRVKQPKPGLAYGELLHALDRHGRVMAKVSITSEIASVTPSALGNGLFDVVLDQPLHHDPLCWWNRPAPSARAVWDLWHEGVPAQRNLWVPFDKDGREAWSELTHLAHEKSGTDQVGGVYELDGRHVTDWRSLHLAMSEAVVGPGRYFGRDIYTLEDCLYGGWGVKPGFTLVWNDAQVAHSAIRKYFADILKLLRGFGATVVTDGDVIKGEE